MVSSFKNRWFDTDFECILCYFPFRTGGNGFELAASSLLEAIRDDEIRLHGAPAGEDQVMDDFFWETILLRSESIDAFSTTERLLSEAVERCPQV